MFIWNIAEFLIPLFNNQQLINFQSDDSGPCEDNIKWADAYVLLYDVTDRCSFDECTRLKFLINIHGNRKSRKVTNGVLAQSNDIPVALVGNKNDLEYERMVSVDECNKKHEELSCTSFHDISVRECIEEVRNVFLELFRVWPRQIKRNSRTSPPLLREKFWSFSEEEQAISAHESNSVKRKESVSRKFMKRMMSSRRMRVSSDGDKPNCSSWNDSESQG